MQHYPLLPSLKEEGNTVAPLRSTGTWEQVGAIELENISRSLNVTTGHARYTNIDSIPSMWARPLLFEMALYDIDHPMHECILGEWRGLLAMLALKEQRNFSLVTEEIEIPAEDDVEYPEFLRALRRLLPAHTLEASTTWDTLYLILFNKKPIGMTSPTTVVCTSVDYVGCISEVPWFDGQFLCDPTSDLNQEERAAVAGWLTHFHRTQIDPRPSHDPNFNQELNERIGFIRECFYEQVHNFTNELLNGTPESAPRLSDTGLGMTEGFFIGINYPIARKEYFTEKLFVINQQDAFLEHAILSPRGSRDIRVGGSLVTPILPIKKEMLADFSVDDLNQRITFEETVTGIKVNLRLSSPGDGPGSDFIISQEYVKKEPSDGTLFESYEIVEIPHLPVLEIWPNFRTPNWRTYYTYFRKAGQDTFYAEPFLATDEEHDFYVLEDRMGNIETKITKTECFPEVMICRYRDPDASNHEEAGILLISAPESLQEGETTWNIGIDFGTSSTTVYRNDLQDLQGSSHPIAFDDRLLQITDSRRLRTSVYDDFFSSKLEETPFFSLFQRHLNSGSNSENRETLEPLLDGRIYFVDDYQLAEDVVSNLKWSPEPIDRVRTQAFLEQICLQCAAEAVTSRVSQINWRFSYPLAFSKLDREQFHNIWTKVTDLCTNVTGIRHGNVISESESVVTAKFFASRFGGFANGTVCIDIGGETSDISIWQNNTACWQTSLRFAGRHIFLDLLKQNLTFLRHFGVDDTDIQLLQRVSRSLDFYSQADTWIDAWINNSEQSLQEKFAIYGGDAQVREFVQLIAIGISGLLYYIGLILNYLGKSRDFERKMPNVYIGGNGSRILHWLANGDFGPYSENNRCLKEIILTASGFDPNSLFDLKITPNPKHEAAAGLVDVDTILKPTEDQFDFLAGEVFTEGGSDYEWTELLTAERFGNRLTPGSKLVQIEKFIEVFNVKLGEALGGPIRFDDQLESRLTADLNDKLIHLHLTDFTRRTIEPLFIVELKRLLKLQTEQWN